MWWQCGPPPTCSFWTGGSGQPDWGHWSLTGEDDSVTGEMSFLDLDVLCPLGELGTLLIPLIIALREG